MVLFENGDAVSLVTVMKESHLWYMTAEDKVDKCSSSFACVRCKRLDIAFPPHVPSRKQ